jgi:hypothetical protein
VGATLRNQIAAANPADTVEIDAGVNPILGGGEIAIDKSLTITGQGANQTMVSANNLSRIFNIGFITLGITVAIENLQLTEGKAPRGTGDGAGGSGGAIINAATLQITNSTLAQNSSGKGVTATTAASVVAATAATAAVAARSGARECWWSPTRLSLATTPGRAATAGAA